MSAISPERFPNPSDDAPLASTPGASRAVLAGGCFWCVEAVYLQLAGVAKVVSGYSGGTATTADYETVCSGLTDHAEVVEVTYDPSRLTFGQILRVFFSIAHDPTTLNRQGSDVGRQYRSVIFTLDAEQDRIARAYIAQLDQAKVFDDPVVTEVVPLVEFFRGEDYHQNYAVRNPGNPYIGAVAMPKVQKARKYLGDLLKP
ncbi:MAG: peptide-methionine (S)-S-oxide reductase MsrA [Chloroflexi bacterium]|nr:peptide-methionine (S)-S-oxide reductase MsrA [Chloroflexota bacterium]